MLIAFNKPFGVLSQFTDGNQRATLAQYIDVPDVYPAGRLDRDSEGLLLLTDDGRLQHRLSAPGGRHWKRYLVHVEGDIDDAALDRLRKGVVVRGHRTLPARARRVAPPKWLWPRNPPIRERRHIPTSWLELSIHEGRNRQVRHMTAAVGYPTLRLVRTAIGEVTLEGLAPGQWRSIDPAALMPRNRAPVRPRSARR